MSEQMRVKQEDIDLNSVKVPIQIMYLLCNKLFEILISDLEITKGSNFTH